MQAIDGNTQTNVLSGAGGGQWLSVRVAANSLVGYVAIWNHATCCHDHLNPFELYVSQTSGDTSSSAYKCAGPILAPLDLSGPFMVDCAGAPAASYVTLRRVGTPGLYLLIG